MVPENIHTPTTEGISHRTPPTPQDFPFSRYFFNPPPPPPLRKFLKYRIYPHPPLEKFYFKRTPQKSVCCEHFRNIKNCLHEEKIYVIKERARRSISPVGVCQKALDTEIIVVFYIYLWSLTSNFTNLASLKILNLNCWNKSGNAKMCFHLICICHVYVPMQILGDQKDYHFSSTQLMIFL